MTLRKALFYFDITEINYSYRDFFASELKLGRFSRWMPGLYCGMPLFSESQAGYLHPLKYLLYPRLKTWQAFNLDTVGSVWLAGIGAYWMAPPPRRGDRRACGRRDVRPRRIHMGASDPHEHGERPHQRPVRRLGPGMLLGRRPAPGGRDRRLRDLLSSLRRAPSGRDPHQFRPRRLRPLSGGDRAEPRTLASSRSARRSGRSPWRR